MTTSYFEIAPHVMDGTFTSAKYVSQSGLEESLIDLVNIRASLINGCAFCLELHFREARASGENEERIATIGAWRDTQFFNERERAALLWTEYVTLIASKPISEAEERFVHEHLTAKELVDLTLAITTINTWNRFNVAFHNPPNPSFKTPRSMAHV
jgi:AhpD family alkylhydroperoxidase